MFVPKVQTARRLCPRLCRAAIQQVGASGYAKDVQLVDLGQLGRIFTEMDSGNLLGLNQHHEVFHQVADGLQV